jgi:AcrR family transcriptional regulator
MAKEQAIGRRERRQPVRVGRPPRDKAGEVDQRILAAARTVFLENGLAGASIDEIARLARAGKPTIYARFPTKEALFAAVVKANSGRVTGRITDQPASGKALRERLVSTGTALLENLLVNDTVDLMRLAVAESRRFPELVQFGRVARERGLQAISQVLGESVRTDEDLAGLVAFAPERLGLTARMFSDLLVARFLLRAVFGENLKALRAEIPEHVTACVEFFLAACRQQGRGS